MTILDGMERETTPDAGPPRTLLALLLVATVLLHVTRIDGPLRDGQEGNCGAMFSLFARNVEAVGWAESRGVPIVNPMPPSADVTPVYYTHHPPGLPWLVAAGAAVTGEAIESARIVALLLTLASVWLLADIVTRVAGPLAGLSAGAMLAAMPSGWHHGLLVNYETVALPALLLVVRATVLGRGSPWLAGALAGLTDFIALVPLVFSPRTAFARGEHGQRWRRTFVTGVVVIVTWAVIARGVAPGSLAETLHQALRTTPFAPDFTWNLWRGAARAHLGALYGWALVPAVIALFLLPRRAPALRQLVASLAAVGVFNVVVFGRHAIGHEHFWLLLAPAIATAIATCIPSRKVSLHASLVGAVLAVSAWQALDARPARSNTRQWDLGTALQAGTSADDTATVFVTERGVPLVLLSASARHVATQPVADRAAAVAVADLLRTRLGLGPGPVHLIVRRDDKTPVWADALPVVADEPAYTLRAVTE